MDGYSNKHGFSTTNSYILHSNSFVIQIYFDELSQCYISGFICLRDVQSRTYCNSSGYSEQIGYKDTVVVSYHLN